MKRIKKILSMFLSVAMLFALAIVPIQASNETVIEDVTIISPSNKLEDSNTIKAIIRGKKLTNNSSITWKTDSIDSPSDTTCTLDDDKIYSICSMRISKSNNENSMKITATSTDDPTKKSEKTFTSSQTDEYSFILSRYGEITVTATEGYSSTNNLNTVIYNSGNQQLTGVKGVLSDPNNFIFNQMGMSETITTDNATTFKIKPKLGLAAGTYSTTITISADNATTQSIDYKFVVETKNEHSVTVNGGTSDKISYKEGETVTITATSPTQGKQFKNWTVEPSAVLLTDATSATTTFTMPSENVTVTANYEDISVPPVQKGELWVNGIDILSDDDNTITCGNGTAEYDENTHTLTLTNAVIDDYYLFDNFFAARIYSKSDLNIKIVGTNTIDKKEINSDIVQDMGVYTEGKLTIIGIGENAVLELSNGYNAIYAIGDVELSSVKFFGASDLFATMLTAGNLSIDKSEVDIHSVQPCAIAVGAGVQINDSQITVLADTPNDDHGIITIGKGQSFTITGNSDVEINGGNRLLWDGESTNVSIQVTPPSDKKVHIFKGTDENAAKLNESPFSTVQAIVIDESDHYFRSYLNGAADNPTTPPSHNPSSSVVIGHDVNGDKIAIDQARPDQVMKDSVGTNHIVTSFKVNDECATANISVKVGKMLAHDEVYILQLNPESNKLELVSISKVDESGVAKFTTDSKEKLTLVTLLPIGYIDTVATKNNESVTYYVDEFHSFKKGWLLDSNHVWQFMDYQTGIQQKNRWVADGNDSDGLAKWYCLDSKGNMYTNTWVYDEVADRRYYVDATGLYIRDLY